MPQLFCDTSFFQLVRTGIKLTHRILPIFLRGPGNYVKFARRSKTLIFNKPAANSNFAFITYTYISHTTDKVLFNETKLFSARFCFRSAIKLLLNFLQRVCRAPERAEVVRRCCLPPNYLAARSRSPEKLTWPNGQTQLKAFHSSIQISLPLPIRNHSDRLLYHSVLLFHCINIHIDATCNDGSIKRGA